MEKGGACSFGGLASNVITVDGLIQIRLEVWSLKKKWDCGPEIAVGFRLRLINCSVTKKKKKKVKKKTHPGETETQKLRLRCCLSTRSIRSTLSPLITLCLAWGNRPWGRSETPLVYPIHLCPRSPPLLETAVTNVSTFRTIITGQSAM